MEFDLLDIVRSIQSCVVEYKMFKIWDRCSHVVVIGEDFGANQEIITFVKAFRKVVYSFAVAGICPFTA